MAGTFVQDERPDRLRAFMPYPAVAVPSAPDGPLAGLSFAVKDLFDVAGYPTSCGSPHKLLLSGLKQTTAPSATRLLEAGGVFAGKALTDELAFSLAGNNAHFGTPINPAAPDRIPGGSSSGSASAVAGGLVDFAIGTDTGGSVRAPASYCGLYGIRPTHGAVSLAGCMAQTPSLDTVGWFARDAATLNRVGDVLLPPAKTDALGEPRALIATDALALADERARPALEPVITGLARRFSAAETLDLPGPGFDALYWSFRRTQGYEAWRELGEFVTRFAPPLGPGVGERLAYARGVSRSDYDDAQSVRAAFRAALVPLLDTSNILLIPTMPDIAPRLVETDAELEAFRNRALRLLCLAGLAGLPQVSLPLASREGAPLGVSLVGPPGSDRALLALACRLTTDRQ